MTKKRKRNEADQLAALLNEAASAPHEPEEALVPGKADWLGSTLEEVRRLAATPRGELVGKAEKLLVKQARRLLKANEQYGISISGLVRTGTMFLLSFPLKRQNES